MRSIAIISCTYIKDSPSQLDEMLQSVFSAFLPENIQMRFYLHVDGVLSDLHEDVLSKYNIYKRIDSSLNLGLAKGLNKLISNLECEDYVFRMDADDICLNDRFIKQIKFMDENKNIDFSGGYIKEFIGNIDNIVTTRTYPLKDLPEILFKGSPFAHVTVCFRRCFFDRFGDYPVEYPLSEDIAYWFKAFNQGAVGENIDEFLVLVRMDGAYKRRNFKRAVSEYNIFSTIAKSQKKSPVFCTLRFLFRLLPSSLVEIIYNSKLRTEFFRR